MSSQSSREKSVKPITARKPGRKELRRLQNNGTKEDARRFWHLKKEKENYARNEWGRNPQISLFIYKFVKWIGL